MLSILLMVESCPHGPSNTVGGTAASSVHLPRTTARYSLAKSCSMSIKYVMAEAAVAASWAKLWASRAGIVESSGADLAAVAAFPATWEMNDAMVAELLSSGGSSSLAKPYTER